jgi:putative FmdB family regulatory protein
MPTYDYECKSCSQKIEIFHSINTNPLKKCPQCGQASLQRLISCGAGVIFKGSGFYQTDYKKPEKENKKPDKPETPKKTSSQKEAAKGSSKA